MNKIMVRYVTLVLLSLLVRPVYSQLLNDTVTIKEVEVNASKFEVMSGVKMLAIDSSILVQYQLNNLGELLQNQTLITFKNWGQSGLSIPTFRGTNANHTRVLWNGIQLNSPMNGQLDFSVVPVSVIQSVEVVYGGASSMYGSGTIGGAVLLNNTVDWSKRLVLHLNQKLASYGNTSSSLLAEYGTARLKGRTALNYSKGKNNFSFRNTEAFGDPVVEMKNSEQQAVGVVQELYLRPQNNRELIIRTWYQENDKNLPGSMLYLSSKTMLNSRAWRNLAQWKHTGPQLYYQLKAAYLHENLLYKDNNIGFNELSISTNYVLSANAGWLISNKAEWSITTDHDLETGYDKVFLKKRLRPVTNIFSNLSYQVSPRIESKFSLRKTIISGYAPPLCYLIGLKAKLLTKEGLYLKLNTSRNYTLPTLNDLYWLPGGNPDLIPENAFNHESGLMYSFLKKNLSIKLEFTGFYGMIDNWISWQPTGFGYWTPRNLKKVRTQGLEGVMELNWKVNNRWSLFASGNYNYIVSTNLKPMFVNDQNAHKQLIYVPYNSIKTYLKITYLQWHAAYTHTFTGFRYITFDNSRFLPSYQLGHLVAGKKVVLKNISIDLNLAVENILNTTYQSVAYYAMPGRTYAINLSFNFNKP